MRFVSTDKKIMREYRRKRDAEIKEIYKTTDIQDPNERMKFVSVKTNTGYQTVRNVLKKSGLFTPWSRGPERFEKYQASFDKYKSQPFFLERMAIDLGVTAPAVRNNLIKMGILDEKKRGPRPKKIEVGAVADEKEKSEAIELFKSFFRAIRI
jgi:hypothetical protein